MCTPGTTFTTTFCTGPCPQKYTISLGCYFGTETCSATADVTVNGSCTDAGVATPTGNFSLRVLGSSQGTFTVSGGDPVSGPVYNTGASTQLLVPSNEGPLLLQPTSNVDGALILPDLTFDNASSTPLPANLLVLSMAATSDGVYAYGGGFGLNQSTPNALLQWGIENYGVTPLTPPTLPLPTGTPAAIAIDPTNHFLYVAMGSGGTVEAFTIGTGGALTANGTTTVGQKADHLAVTPDGKALFVADSGDAYVAQYTIGSTGALTPASPATVPLQFADAGSGNVANVALWQSGSSIYAYATLESIQTFSVTNDLLVPTSAAPIALPAPNASVEGFSCQNVAVDQGAGILLVACPQVYQLLGYTIGAGGALTPASWSPYTPDLSYPTAGISQAGPLFVSVFDVVNL
jgi:DNA-binding beta-propeller fold protein YncE